MYTLNKSLSSPSKQNPQQTRLYDHLQNIYNSDARSNKLESKIHKQLYFKIVQQNQKNKQQKKSIEKSINQHQNQQIDLFWKNRQNQLRQRERRNRQMIDQTRNLNNNMFGQKMQSKALSRSMTIQPTVEQNHKNWIEQVARYENKMHQSKQTQQRFLQQGQAYQDYKQYQRQFQRQKALEAQRKKIRQSQQLQHKRLQQLQKWRKKYLQSHNKQAYEIWDRARRNRMSQQDALDNYIVFQGARQLNQRTSKMKNQIFQRQNTKKQQFIRELHSQLQDNEYRTGNDSKILKQYQRKILEQRNMFLREKDKFINEQKSQQHKNHLQILKSQIKPRNLLPQKQKLQFPGLGSPVHIGKAVAQDRRKQLQVLQRNLYKELSL